MFNAISEKQKIIILNMINKKKTRISDTFKHMHKMFTCKEIFMNNIPSLGRYFFRCSSVPYL